MGCFDYKTERHESRLAKLIPVLIAVGMGALAVYMLTIIESLVMFP